MAWDASESQVTSYHFEVGSRILTVYGKLGPSGVTMGPDHTILWRGYVNPPVFGDLWSIADQVVRDSTGGA